MTSAHVWHEVVKIMARRILGITLSTVLLISTMIGCGKQDNQAAGRSAGGGKLPVAGLVIVPQPLVNRINATGTLLANEEVALRPEISGRVVAISFSEGSRVRKGQLLVKINDADLQAELKGKRLEEKLAADEERRKKGLLDIAGISQEEYDKSANTFKMIQAEREVIESQIAKTEIVAPFNGVVGLRDVSQGSYVTPDILMATMQEIDPMKVEFSVPEKYARQVQRGTPIRVEAGDAGQELAGMVFAVESKIDLGTRTIRARATIPNPKGDLIPGSFVKVDITLESLTDAIVVPTGAIIPQLGGDKVFIGLNGKAKAVPIKTGIRNESTVQVIEGLHAGDTLLTTGLLQLSEGRQIEVRFGANQ